jgi:uncharacterized protein YcfJ
MKKHIKKSLLIVTLMSATNVAIANELMIFPAKGQSAETQEQDKFSCYGWAKGQSGFDPMAVPTTTTAPPKSKQGSVAGSTAKGAIGGAVLGKIVGGNKKSAKRGALAGGLVGGVSRSSKNSKSERKQAEWEQKEANNYANNRNSYNRAYSACLEGKGYTVK